MAIDFSKENLATYDKAALEALSEEDARGLEAYQKAKEANSDDGKLGRLADLLKTKKSHESRMATIDEQIAILMADLGK